MLCQTYPFYAQEGACNPNHQLFQKNDRFPYLEATVCFTSLVFFFELYLDLRQLTKFNSNSGIPKELVAYVKEDTFKKSLYYRRDKLFFKIVESSFSFALAIIFIFCGYLPFVWDLSYQVGRSFSVIKDDYSSMTNEIIVTWLFVALQTLSDTLINLPFSLYSTFVVEQKHGFNKSTLALFLQDKLISLALVALFSVPILPGIIWLVRSGGEFFYFYVWMFLFIISIFLMIIYPTVIAPLFNKFTKLEEGDIKTGIEELAKSVSFPLTELYVVDGSRRSAHSNAYFYGFFKSKRIVLFDTLLKQVELPEIIAILGHEIGHWKVC